MAREPSPVSATALKDDLLRRAAVLSAFDVEWIHPDLADAEVDDVADFLSSSCERVVDATGTPRWRLGDRERSRVLRTGSPASLRAALDSVAVRPDDEVQAALELYLSGSFPPLDQLDAAGLSAALQLERWVGEDAGLPAASTLQARVEWLTLVEPLQRLVAHGFFGRKDLLAELKSFVERDATPQPDVFLIEGVGGSGKSTTLARFILDLPAAIDVRVYMSLDRGWLIDGGPWALFDEIVRQVGAQLAELRPRANDLRQQAQQLAGRSSGFSDIASRSSQQRDRVDSVLLQNLATLLVGRGRLVVVVDTLEELARRDESLAYETFDFLADLSRSPMSNGQVRVVAAGRSLPEAALFSARRWHLTGLDDTDALQLLQGLTVGIRASNALLREIIGLAGGNPLSLHLAADVLKRTGQDPTQLIAVAEGNVQGQLYSRLLEHIRDPQVRAVAHPGLVVRRLTPDIIREVLAEPCGIGPLGEAAAMGIFEALRHEATLCEPSPDGDGALVHRQDVRALMLPSIQQDRPGTTRAIHAAAVRYYEDAQESPGAPVLSSIARREELYHRLMLKQDHASLDGRWDPGVAADLTAVIDELPPRSQLYLATKVRGLRLDEAARSEADDDQWQQAVRPTAMSRLQSGEAAEALDLVRERRGRDGRPLLPDLEIEALERLERKQEALDLARLEQQHASQQGDLEQVRALISQEARILERMRRWSEAWTLLDRLAVLDRERRRRTDALDEEVRVRELVVLTSMLRIARQEQRQRGQTRKRLSNVIGGLRQRRQADRHIDELTRETVELAEATPQRLLIANPSLLRDLAGELGRSAPRIVELAVSALGTSADTGALGNLTVTGSVTQATAKASSESAAPPTGQAADSWSTQFRSASDAALAVGQGTIRLYFRIGITGHRHLNDPEALVPAIREAARQLRNLLPEGPESAGFGVGTVAVSSLVEGADRLVTRELLAEPGSRLDAVLPMPPADYVDDFSSEESRDEFQRLLGQAGTVLLAPSRATREEAYEWAGRQVVDRCDALIAVWDGQAARGRGGTAEIVRYARDREVPLAWVHATGGPQVTVEAGSGSMRAETLRQGIQDLNNYNGTQIIAAAFESHLRAHRDSLGLASTLAVPDVQLEQAREQVAAWLIPFLVRADLLATRLQRRFHIASSAMFVMPAVAVALIAIQANFFPQQNWIGGLVVLLLVLLLAGLPVGNRLRFHDRWASYRFLAERLRSAYFLALAGTGERGPLPDQSTSFSDPSVAWIERALAEIAARRPAVRLTSSDVASLRSYLNDFWIGPQTAYCAAASARDRSRGTRLKRATEVLFLVALVCTVLYTFKFGPTLHATADLVALSISVPAIGAAVYGIQSQRDYSRHAARCRRMMFRLTQLQDQLSQAQTLDDIGQVAADVERSLREESAEWFGAIRFHNIELIT